MCDVPSTAVSCRKSIERRSGIVSRFFEGFSYPFHGPSDYQSNEHLIFQIRWVFVLRFSHFNLFSLSFCVTFLPEGIETPSCCHVLCLAYLPDPSLPLVSMVPTYVCAIASAVLFHRLMSCVLGNADVYTFYRVLFCVYGWPIISSFCLHSWLLFPIASFDVFISYFCSK
jgi:hypothetical protein